MPNRAELVLRASAANVDHTLAKYNNDSLLEQAVLYAEGNVTAASGTASTKAPTVASKAQVSGGKNV